MMAANVGAIAGYTLSGVMITFFGWRSMFLVNVPIGIFGTLWGYFRLKEIGIKTVGQKIRLRRFNIVLHRAVNDSAGFDCGRPHFTP